ncbi:MAG: Exodeoxyribonuclease III [Legionellaceae bacterium]
MFKIATWNVNSLRARLPHIVEWLTVNQPDILALQETKVEDKDFPYKIFEDLNYQIIYSGQKSYNGMAIISKKKAEEIITENPFFPDVQRRLLAATINNIRIINLYIPNGESVGSAKFEYKLQWLEKMQQFLKQELIKYPYLIVLGDFNIAPEDKDIHDPEIWRGKVLCTEPERFALQAWCNLGLNDSFRLFEKEAGYFSWWDYRAAGFRRNLGLRIDHILINQALIPHCQHCFIDKEPRAWDRPSDHTPVMAVFNL